MYVFQHKLSIGLFRHLTFLTVSVIMPGPIFFHFNLFIGESLASATEFELKSCISFYFLCLVLKIAFINIHNDVDV